jgi:hypothetical protein
VLYTTTQTHSLGKKAGLVLGLRVRALQVTAEDDYALRGETLKVALKEDKGAGLHPFILSMLFATDLMSWNSCRVALQSPLSERHLRVPSIDSARSLSLVRILERSYRSCFEPLSIRSKELPFPLAAC